MKHIVKTEEEWHNLRSQFVTASEAAALVGVDPYNSPAKIRQPSTFTGNAFTEVGQVLEPVVVNITNRVLGTHFELYETAEGTKEFYTEGNLGATPDAHQDRQILLECKTTRPHTYEKYSVVPPEKYLIQLIVQMLTTGIKEGYLSILSTNLTQETSIINWPITIFKVLHNDELCNILISEAARFKDDEKFRVNSKTKQKVKLILSCIHQRVVP